MKALLNLVFLLFFSLGICQNVNSVPIEASSEPVFSKPDKKAEYPGGLQELRKEVSKTLYYPEEAKIRNIQGKVIVNFIVEKDGSISDIKIFKDIGRQCGAEAVKALSAVTVKWKPAQVKGEPVRSYFSTYILFKK